MAAHPRFLPDWAFGSKELEAVLGVEVKHALLELEREEGRPPKGPHGNEFREFALKFSPRWPENEMRKCKVIAVRTLQRTAEGNY